jgi:mitogen-activated protein kinase 15
LATQIVNNIPKGQRIGFTSYFPKATPQALDLIRRLLAFNPQQRITVEDALRHPYVASFHNDATELTTHPVVIPMDDNKKFSIKEYREALYQEITKKYDNKYDNKCDSKFENTMKNSDN